MMNELVKRLKDIDLFQSIYLSISQLLIGVIEKEQKNGIGRKLLNGMEKFITRR